MTTPIMPTPSAQGLMTLVLGWRSGSKMKLRRVNMSDDVVTELRMVAVAVASDLAGRTVEFWSPEIASAPEVVHVLPVAEVGPAPTLARDVENLAPLLNALRNASSLPSLTSEALPAADLAFYALTIGDDAADRSVWLRRTNPRRGLRRGRIFTQLSDTLTKVDHPIFGFEDDLDLVAVDGVLGVLNQGAFKAIFRHNEDLVNQVPTWLATVTSHLPITDAAEQVLAARCQSDSRARTKLEAISHRNHLPSIPPATIRQRMTAFGLDASRFFDDQGKLDFGSNDVPDLLKVLNEDLFKGLLTDTPFRADRKAQEP